MDYKKYTSNYFLFLFSFIPISTIAGSAVLLTNIFLLDLSFLILILIKRDFSFLKTKPIIFLLFLYVYLIFNSLISIDIKEGLYRNFGFFIYIFLFAAFNYFMLNKKFLKKVLNFWIIILIIVSIDVFFESFNGKNIIGFTLVDDPRIVSFFKDEPIVGSYILGFYLLLTGFLFDYLKNKYLLFAYLIVIVLMISIFITGERSSSIKAFIGVIFFLFFLKSINFKKKLIIFFSIIFFMFVILFNSQFLQIRFISQIKSLITNETIYFDLYRSGFQVFKNNKLFGVGNKNYRVETCKPKNQNETKTTNRYLCNTHPHQIYIELLSEHGLIGLGIIFFILFKLIFVKILDTFKTTNYLKIGSLIYLLLVFIPILPSGAFFGSFLFTIFMINLSILYASEKQLNIFNK